MISLSASLRRSNSTKLTGAMALEVYSVRCSRAKRRLRLSFE